MASHSQNKLAAGADMGRSSSEASALTQWPAMCHLHLTTGHREACHGVCVCASAPVLEPGALHPTLSQIFICCRAAGCESRYRCPLPCLRLHYGKRKQVSASPSSSPLGRASHLYFASSIAQWAISTQDKTPAIDGLIFHCLEGKKKTQPSWVIAANCGSHPVWQGHWQPLED